MRTISLAALAAAGVFGVGCGGAAAQSSTQTAAVRPVGAGQQHATRHHTVSPRAVARALRADQRDGVQAATCQRETAATRAASPFGDTRRPVFTCTVRQRGQNATYAVQVLSNHCFVAERLRRGHAIYGCGVRRS